jgi:hypothetical protein
MSESSLQMAVTKQRQTSTSLEGSVTEPTQGMPPADLRAWGYAPGSYAFRCSDCVPSRRLVSWEALGDKRSTRCKAHAVEAWRASVCWEPAPEAPSDATIAALAEALGMARRKLQTEHKASVTSKGIWTDPNWQPSDEALARAALEGVRVCPKGLEQADRPERASQAQKRR